MVGDAALATSALRLPGRWQHWPRATRLWVQWLFDSNPLRRVRGAWQHLCGGCPDFPFIQYVLEHGAVVTAPSQRPRPYDMPNHGSCRTPENAARAGAIIAAERAAAFISVPSPWFEAMQCHWVHPLGVIPKTASSVRVIHDFSSPSSDCLNAHIDYLKTSYDKVDAAFAVLRPRSYMAKIDISAFFRHIPIDPADWGLLAFRWDGQMFVDTRLNFGQRNAPEMAMRFSNCVLWHVEQRLVTLPGTCDVFVVCDDWLVVSICPDFCRTVWLLIIDVLQQLGFAVNTAPHKCIAPTWVIVWLGLELDTEVMTVRLPAAKVQKALACVRGVLVARKVSRRQLDSLFGYLSYCSAVVFGGRAFLHGLRHLRFRGGEAERGVRAAHHLVHVNSCLRADCRWWDQCLELRNGDRRVPIVSMNVAHRLTGITLDARGGSGGVGLWVNGGFVGLTGLECNERYPSGGALVSPGAWDIPSVEANHWEMFAFCVLLDLFPLVVADQFVVIESDSITACKCVRTLTAALKSPELAVLTRQFLLLCVEHNVRVLPRHIAGVDNVLADPLSRADWPRFGREAEAWCVQQGFPGSPFLATLGHQL